MRGEGTLKEKWGLYAGVPRRAICLAPLIGSQAMHLLIYLLDYANVTEKKWEVYPSYRRILLDTGMSFRTVASAIAWLKYLGFIKIVNHPFRKYNLTHPEWARFLELAEIQRDVFHYKGKPYHRRKREKPLLGNLSVDQRQHRSNLRTLRANYNRSFIG